MDNATRNLIQQATQAARRLLEDDYLRQLEGKYDIHPDGTIAPNPGKHLDDREKIVRGKIVSAIQHSAAGGARPEESVYGFRREAAFTTLNRFVALKMMEARGLVQECVSRGEESLGFREFLLLAPGLSVLADQAYMMYIESIFDEIGLEVRVLFDRRDLASLLWPRRPALIELLGVLNAKELKDVWAEDETIGWVYQYFNSQEERREMRESQTPRNSRELAVRNQFFTPRYVVQFLTDNTLGRIWYEMRKGATALKEKCRYLVRRPTEIFLAPGENTPNEVVTDVNLTQEDLLKNPAYIEHRPTIDPRDLKVLDPACGSGHFLLYAFGLLQTIFEEAWIEGGTPASKVTGKTLREDYSELGQLRNSLPELILRHNLYGIDIDRRAVQIAAFALWMRAQRAWRDLGIMATARPAIRRSNVICAEAMPGETDLLREFTATLQPKLLGQLVEIVFEKMKLGGEAGSLLKIEEEIRESIAEAKKQWASSPHHEQGLLFPERQKKEPEQGNLFDVHGVTDESFWHQAEGRITGALLEYAEQAENGRRQRRRLFADDAAQGFAFVDLCRNRFDVVLMNPPFGAGTRQGQSYIATKLPDAKDDLGMAFVARFSKMLASGGRVGAITTRVFVANDTLEGWRHNYLLGEVASLREFFDLGYGILDDAMVEVAAYVVEATKSRGLIVLFHRILDEREKEEAVYKLVVAHEPKSRSFCFLRALEEFKGIPSAIIAYQVPGPLLHSIFSGKSVSKNGGKIVQGLIPSDDFRFLRLAWEISPLFMGRENRWVSYAKGGEYGPYWDDIHLVVNWHNDGEEIRNFFDGVGKLRSRPQNVSFYFKEGLTYPERTTSDFSPRVLPRNSIFSATGQGIFCGDHANLLGYLGGAFSRGFKLLVDAFVGSGDCSVPGSAAKHYRSGLMTDMPPGIWHGSSGVASKVFDAVRMARASFDSDETSRTFSFLSRHYSTVKSLRGLALLKQEESLARAISLLAIHENVEPVAHAEMNISADDGKVIDVIVGPHPCSYEIPSLGHDSQELEDLWPLSESGIISTAVTRHGARRQLTKKSFLADRRLELVAHTLQVHPKWIAEQVNALGLLPSGAIREESALLVQYALGCLFGRWDLRIALDLSLSPNLADPFDALPICSPGMLVGPDGLPAKMGGIASEEWLRARLDVNSTPPKGSVLNPAVGDSSYPLRICWDGVIVDDSGWEGGTPHQDDIVRRVREVLLLLWEDNAHGIEEEACEILCVPDLRDYFRGTEFFDDHLKMYSKSRRKAPIYGRLSTLSGNYSVWIYYHRFTKDTFYKVLNEYIDPKIEYEERGLISVRQEAGPLPSAGQRKEIEARAGFLAELKAFRDEIARIAPLWNPDLNDGVIINYTPLWRLVPHHRAWQKDLKECWESLVAGEYDWSHLAMHLWPERVVPKCADDLSLAIAHGLENVFWEKDAKGKWKKRKVAGEEVKRLVVERTSSSVKAALNDFPSASGAVENGKRTRKPRAKSTSKGKA